MTLPPDRERVRQILSETIGLLCRNGLSFDFELSVDALIGITVDHKDVFLISIKDTYDSEKNLQQPCNSNSVTAAQILNDSGEKNGCSRPSSALKCNFPSSMTNEWICAEKNFSSEKQTALNNFFPAQSCCKRMIERNESLGDQTKRARISVDANVEASQVKPMLLAVVKSEPCDSLLATNTSGTMSCEKPNSSTSHGQRSSGTISLVNSKLNSVIDSVRLRIRVPSYNEDNTGKVPDVSCVAKDSSSNDSPSDSSVHQNKSCEISSQLSSGCNDGVSSFDKQNISHYPEANSKSDKPISLPPSNVHTQNFSVASRYNLQVPSICLSSQSAIVKRAISEGSSDSLAVEKASEQTKSQTSVNQRKDNEVICDSHVESASSDSEVICIKEEIPYLPFNSVASFPANSRPSLQNTSARLKEIARTSVDSLNLESLSYDHSVGWKGMQNNFLHHVRRQQKDAWSTWNHDNVMPSSFMDTQSLEKLLIQAAQSILLYDGQYVPLRDIQRLRLCGMAAGQIKLAMEQLSSYDGKLGCFQVLHGGVNLFYKCPPNLVDKEILESSYCIPWDTYKFHYDVTPASNITTKHNEQYWLKVASSSPYDPSNRALHVA